MISHLKYKGEKGILISYSKNDVKKEITFNDTSAICNGLNEENFEGGKAYVWNKKYIAFSVLNASGQGSVFFVWDTDIEEFVHYSNCSYCADAIWINNDVLFLCEVSNYVTPYHLEVYSIPFGTRDISTEGQRLYSESPEEYHSSIPMGVSFVIDGNRLLIADDDTQHLYSSNVDVIKEQKPQSKFLHLYEDYGVGLNPKKLVIRSMIT